MELKYINPPFCYTGSKFKLLSQLLPLFDYSKENFIDMFTGGGSVAYNVLDKYKYVFLSDKIRPLIGIHQKFSTHGNEFVNKVKSLCANNKEEFISLRNVYNKFFRDEELMALMLCCTNNMARFNKGDEFNQTFGKRTFNSKTQEKIDLFLPHIQKYKEKLRYVCGDFIQDKIIENEVGRNSIKKSMLYFDPPYNTKGENNGAAYNSSWRDEHDKHLFSICKKIDKIGGSFCVSNVWSENNNLNAPVVNSLLKEGYQMIKLNGNYKKVARKKDKEQMVEIIIKNYCDGRG